MSEINSEDPAFPVMHANGTFTGLTKREYFAAMAMQGILSNDATIDSHNIAEIQWISLHAVMQADNLIEQLNK